MCTVKREHQQISVSDSVLLKLLNPPGLPCKQPQLGRPINIYALILPNENTGSNRIQNPSLLHNALVVKVT